MSNEIVPGKTVYEKIVAVTAELNKLGITKNRKNAQQGYAFRGIDDIYNALSGALAGNGLCILPRYQTRTITERQTAKGGTLFYVVLDGEIDFVSAADGSKHTVRVFGEAMDSADKATNKAMSAAYKYACLQVFCIPTEGDNDADGTTHANTAPISIVLSPEAIAEISKAADHKTLTDICGRLSTEKPEFRKLIIAEYKKREAELNVKPEPANADPEN